ncbi:MAG TPA: C39 family peptidase [Elusimicrobiales bacterium]|nr:C39 family peptidase [Elusimicrobiales bacterium]
MKKFCFKSFAVAVFAALFANPSGVLFAQQKEVALKKKPFDLSNIIRVPNIRQATDYTCCVASFQSVLAYYGIELREDELAKELKADPKEGVMTPEVRKAALARGLKADRKTDASLADLKKALDEKKPTLLLIQAWPSDKAVDYAKDWDDGHCVIGVGYDEKNLYIMDPSVIGRYAYIPLDEFLVRWHDFDGPEKVHNLMMPIYGLEPQYLPEEPVRSE